MSYLADCATCELRVCDLGDIRLTFKFMNIFRSGGALRAGAGLFVLVVGCGAAAIGAGATVLVPDTTTTVTNATAGEVPAPPSNPGGPTRGGGALPVVPAGGGGCIPGLQCGCIRGITCPGDHIHHPHPAPANVNPPGAQTGPRPGGGG